MATSQPAQLAQICQSCYQQQQQKVQITIKQLKLQQKRQQLSIKLEQMNIKNLIRHKQLHRKQQKIRVLKEKIIQLKTQIVEQQAREERLKQIAHFYTSQFRMDCVESNEKYLQDMKIKNMKLKEQLQKVKKQKKEVLSGVMKLFSSEERKYKIMKYFRIQENKNVIFTLEKASYGIPVIKANNEQVIKFYPLQYKEKTVRNYEESSLIQTLKITHKFVVIIQKIMLNCKKLPYKMYFFKQYYYIANTFIKFDNELIDFKSSQFLNFVNMLQANIEYLAYLIGAQEKPFLVLNKTFLDELEKCNYQVVSNKDGTWRSFLKYLNPSQIENHYEQQQHASQVIVVGLQKDSDEQFQILE